MTNVQEDSINPNLKSELRIPTIEYMKIYIKKILKAFFKS